MIYEDYVILLVGERNVICESKSILSLCFEIIAMATDSA
jgi:hypothetical protein